LNFSRVPDCINLEAGSHLTPIPIDDEISSLSAILLNDDYYHFLHAGRQKSKNLSIVNASHLIPLKARAWLDLDARKSAGDGVDEKDIRKHKNDILRLYQLLTVSQRVDLPQTIKNDMTQFINRLEEDKTIDLKTLGLKQKSLQEIIRHLRQIY